MRALFLCSRNRKRSPTAEAVAVEFPGVEADSAGLAADAEVALLPEAVEWAEVIFMMERAHRSRLNRDFGRHLRGKRVVCLDVPDDNEYMQPELVALLKRRLTPHLRS